MDLKNIGKRTLYNNLMAERKRVRKLLIIIQSQAIQLKKFAPNDETEDHLLNVEDLIKQYDN